MATRGAVLELDFEDNDGNWLRRGLVLLIVAPLFLLIWAAYATLDEVAVGNGKVVPSSRSQVIQSPDGGVVRDILVAEGDTVEADQVLALLDPAIAQASAGEADAKVQALMARAARLEAELNQMEEIDFPPTVDAESAISAKELSLFHTRRSAHQTAKRDVQVALDLAEDEVRLIEPLLATGAASQLEFLRAQQKVNDLRSRLNQIEDDYMVEARGDLAQTIGELEPLLSIQTGRSSQLARTEIRSPVRGVVKEIAVATIGGVVAPGGKLFEVVPIDDRLLIEARISPRDIAFIHPGQQAAIKITAYDSAIYGTLDATVELIAPDTVEDEAARGTFYYRVLLRTQSSDLKTNNGVAHPIIPGMIASAEIRTGQRTVLEYLVKPLNRAAEALRER